MTGAHSLPRADACDFRMNLGVVVENSLRFGCCGVGLSGMCVVTGSLVIGPVGPLAAREGVLFLAECGGRGVGSAGVVGVGVGGDGGRGDGGSGVGG